MEKINSVPFNVYTEHRFRLSIEESLSLMSGGRFYKKDKGESIYDAGKAADTVYYLKSGSIKYHMIYPDGSDRTTAIAESPSFLGVMNLIPGQEVINYCTAVTECELYTCPITVFMQRLKERDLSDKFLEFCLGAFRHSYQNLTSLLYQDRLQLVDSLRTNSDLTLQEIADILGCTRIHVSRLSKQLRDSKKKSGDNEE
ncbi:MAG: Crp/Fnr family transcriptional regulator [Lachnospiraceae bacterium]|nr:Crp/Fnr family transcriptional regulator [Lachnospiraceae bacterium]